MATTKEQLSAHCDKVAYVAVAVITAVLLFLTSGGQETNQNIKDINTNISEIKTNTDVQDTNLKTPPPIPLDKEIQRIWFKNDYGNEGFQPFAFYARPTVVRFFEQATIHKAVHEPAVIQNITIRRDDSLEKPRPVINLTYDLGKMANVTPTSINIERQKQGDNTWDVVKEVEAAEYTVGEENKGLTFLDDTVEAGAAYSYRIASNVTKEAGRDWEDGSKDKQVSAVAPDAAALAGFVVPDDTQIMLFQAEEATTGKNGSAYFNVQFYNYETKKIEKISMHQLLESLDKKPTKESELLPKTPYYLLYVSKNKDGKMEAILGHWKEPGKKLTVVQGKWYPESIQVPAPWTPGGGAADDASADNGTGMDETTDTIPPLDEGTGTDETPPDAPDAGTEGTDDDDEAEGLIK